MNLKIVIHSAEEGGYWAEVPALPGCASQGDDLQELMTNIREAIDGHLNAQAYEVVVKPGDEIVEITV